MNAFLRHWQRSSDTPLVRYGLAVVVSLLVLFARWLLDPLLGDYVPYITFFAGVAFLSVYAGWGPAMFSAALVLVLGVRWWASDTLRILENTSALASATAYLVVCGVISMVGHSSRRSRRRLQRTEILFQTFLDNSPGLNFLKDDTGRYVYVNKTFAERFGHNFLGKTDFDLFPDYTAIQFREHELIALWESKPHEFTETTHEADGEHTWLSVKFPVIDADGRGLLGGKSIDITERAKAQAEIVRLEQERAARDAAELEAMTRLHDLGLLCQRKESTQRECLEAILDAAIFFTSAAKGNLQLYDNETNGLYIAVYRGFQPAFLEFFSNANEVAASCGYALRANQRAIVEDITTSEIFAGTPSLDVLLAENVHAVQSTPLISTQGKIFGVFSTHFSRPHRPDERQLRLLDLLARQAADYLERKQAEAELTANEERLRLASQAARFGTYDADFATGKRYWSPELRAIVGIDPDAPTGELEAVPEFVYPDDRPLVQEKMRAAHDPNGTGLIEDEHRVLWPDGTVRWVMMKGLTLFAGEGEQRHPIRATGIVQDITERKRADADRAQLAALVESSDDAIYIYNFAGVIRTWNHSAERLYGWRAEEIIGQPADCILPPDLKLEIKERIIPTIRAGATLGGYETRRMRRDATVFDALITASPLRNGSGEPVAVSIIARDITGLKLAEEALRSSTTQLQSFLDSVPTGLTRCSRDLRYVAANQSCAKLVGLPVEQIVGRPIADVMGAEAWQAIRPYVDRVLAGETVEYEAVIHYANTGPRNVHVVYTPERDGSGQVSGWIASITDITEFSQMQARLHRAEKLAAAGQLAASLAHEINNPLSTIVDAFYVLKGQLGLDDDGKIVVEMADAEVARLSRIVKQSLSYYRTGEVSQDVDLALMVEQSLDVFSGIIRGSGIEVKQKLTFGVSVSGYPDEVRQVIDNLLLNAIEASPKAGRIVISVRTSKSWKDGAQAGVRLTIADSGCGIPRENLVSLFEPAFTTKAEKGTGFGLWVVSSIVSKHDGTIRVRTSQRVNHSGSVFSIFFPAVVSAPVPDAQIESESTA